MNTYVCSNCRNEFDTDDMPWFCPHCNADAQHIFYIGTNIPVMKHKQSREGNLLIPPSLLMIGTN